MKTPRGAKNGPIAIDQAARIVAEAPAVTGVVGVSCVMGRWRVWCHICGTIHYAPSARSAHRAAEEHQCASPS